MLTGSTQALLPVFSTGATRALPSFRMFYFRVCFLIFHFPRYLRAWNRIVFPWRKGKSSIFGTFNLFFFFLSIGGGRVRWILNGMAHSSQVSEVCANFIIYKRERNDLCITSLHADVSYTDLSKCASSWRLRHVCINYTVIQLLSYHHSYMNNKHE